MISQGRFWRLEEQSIKIVSSSFVEYGSWWWNEVMEINWWKSMPWCCEPCFLIKDPKLLFPGMGCFPRVPGPVLRADVPPLCVGMCHRAGASSGQCAWQGQWHHWWHWPGPALGGPSLLHWAVTAAHSLEIHFKDNLDHHIDQINIFHNTATLFIDSCYFTPNKKVLWAASPTWHTFHLGIIFGAAWALMETEVSLSININSV